MNPVYSVLPKDYAPFSPLGDGGMLFHTGRMFACAGACAGNESWSMDLWAANEDRIVLDGKTLQARAHWTDRDEGRVVYVGASVPQQTRDFIAVIDSSLPEDIRSRLLVQLPQFMQLFSAKLGALPRRPMLFVSYDISHPKGWGQQGGVLPDQIFTHFYGSKWPEQMRKPAFTDNLAWHLAHEAAHLYQRANFAQAEAMRGYTRVPRRRSRRSLCNPWPVHTCSRLATLPPANARNSSRRNPSAMQLRRASSRPPTAAACW